MSTSRYISQPDKNKLYALSAGQCNLCKARGPEILESAHIIAHSPNGARGEYNFQGNINSYDNIILLCPNCHAKVDKQPEKYSVEYLREIKSNHEKEISCKLNLSSRRNSDIQFLNLFFKYGNLIYIPHFTKLLPSSVNLNILDFIEVYKNLSMNYAIYPLKDSNLQNYLNSLITNFNSLWLWIEGSTPVEGAGYSWQHFSQAEGMPSTIRRLYDHLPYERNKEIDEHINIELKNFMKSHYDFIQYVRQYYPEVKLQ